MLKPFIEDLKRGQINEKRFGAYLESKGYTDIKFSEWKTYDILATKDGQQVTFEVKTDFIVSENIAVEFFCLRREQVSGILATESDYWVQFFGYEDAFVFKTSDLKQFILDTHPKIVYGGDGKNALLFLIKKSELPNHKIIHVN